MNRRIAVFPRHGLVRLTDRFEYTASAGWRPVQRVLFWLLSKIGANSQERVIVSHVTLDAKKLSLALIERYRSEVNRLMYRPSRLIIGADEWADLMGDARMDQVLRFSAPVDFRNGEQRLMDLDVTIVPWMDGVLILPQETERSSK